MAASETVGSGYDVKLVDLHSLECRAERTFHMDTAAESADFVREWMREPLGLAVLIIPCGATDPILTPTS